MNIRRKMLMGVFIVVLAESSAVRQARAVDVEKNAFSGVPIVQYTHPVQIRAPIYRKSWSDVAFVPKGDGGVHYRGDLPGSEMLPQGPEALAVDRSGGFWLLDTVSGHILHLSRTGSVIADFDKSADLIHGAALALGQVGASKQEVIAVLDRGTKLPRVLEYNRQGVKISETNLPIEWSGCIHQIALNSDGSFDTFVVAGEIGRYRVSTKDGSTSYFRVPSLGYWGMGDGSAIELSGHKILPVDPDNLVMEKQLLGATPQGDRLFRVGEFAGDAEGNIYVDVTVQRFRSDGRVDMARVPVRDQYVPVDSNDGIAIDPRTGELFALVPRPKGAWIRRLEFVDHL